MPSILISLAIGLSLILIGFTLLYSLTRMQGKQAALIMFMAVMGVYIPYSILKWPGMDVFAIHFALFGVLPYILGIITTHWEIRKQMGDEGSGRWFHWAPATMVVFFIIIATVDAIIITLSRDGMSQAVLEFISPRVDEQRTVTTAFPGTVSHDYQEKESLYNDYQAQLEEQRLRGWQIRKGFVVRPYAGQDAIFQLQVLDRNGRPLDNATASGQFLRPSDKRQDFSFEMQAVGPGLFRSSLLFPQAGRWYLVLVIRQGDQLHEIRGWTRIEAGQP
jgi:nitrogen fixation protein FixH